MTTNLPVFSNVPEPNRPDTYYFQYWDCHQCEGDQAKHLNAVWEKFCPKCGHPMKDEWCYDDKDAPEIKDRESLMIAKGGDNWNCGYCGVVNFERAEFCSACGVGKSAGAAQKAVEPPPKMTPIPRPVKKSPPRWQGFDLRRVGVFVGGLALFGCLIFGIWWYFFNTTETMVEMDRPYWTVSVPMQEYKGIPGSGSSLPANATMDSKGTEVVGYGKIQGQDGVTKVPTKESVITGWGRCREKQANGTVKETDCATKEVKIVGYGEERVPQYTQVPTFGPHYEYHIMGWTPASPVSTSGFDFNPHPPKVNETETYKISGPPQYGYYVYFRNVMNKHVYNQLMPFSTEASWRAAANKKFIGYVNGANVLVWINDPSK